jgi:hypothetical protein
MKGLKRTTDHEKISYVLNEKDDFKNPFAILVNRARKNNPSIKLGAVPRTSSSRCPR